MYKISALLISVLFFAILFSAIFTKVKTDCKSQYGVCPPEIINELKRFDSKKIWEAKSGIKKTLKGNPLVSDFSLQFKLPNTILVNLIVKKAFYAIRDGNSQKIALIGSDGKILAFSEKTTLPLVLADHPLGKTGESISSKDFEGVKILSGVFEMYQVETAAETGDSLVIELPAGVRVIFPYSGDPEILLGALRLIYNKIENGDKKFSEIDLRFSSPILR